MTRLLGLPQLTDHFWALHHILGTAKLKEMKFNLKKSRAVLAYGAVVTVLMSTAGSHLWAAETQRNQPQKTAAMAQSQSPDLRSKIGKNCFVYYSPAQTTVEEGILTGVSDQWVVITKPYDEESIEHWFPMSSVHYISFPNLKPKK